MLFDKILLETPLNNYIWKPEGHLCTQTALKVHLALEHLRQWGTRIAIGHSRHIGTEGTWFLKRSKDN